MKSDREFLDSMWQTVSEIEYMEKEIQAAKERNFKILKRNIILYSSIFLIFISVLILSTFNITEFKDYVYSISFPFFIIGYIIDNNVKLKN